MLQGRFKYTATTITLLKNSPTLVRLKGRENGTLEDFDLE